MQIIGYNSYQELGALAPDFAEDEAIAQIRFNLIEEYREQAESELREMIATGEADPISAEDWEEEVKNFALELAYCDNKTPVKIYQQECQQARIDYYDRY